jgi:hypothetical protein
MVCDRFPELSGSGSVWVWQGMRVKFGMVDISRAPNALLPSSSSSAMPLPRSPILGCNSSSCRLLRRYLDLANALSSDHALRRKRHLLTARVGLASWQRRWATHKREHHDRGRSPDKIPCRRPVPFFPAGGEAESRFGCSITLFSFTSTVNAATARPLSVHPGLRLSHIIECKLTRIKKREAAVLHNITQSTKKTAC